MKDLNSVWRKLSPAFKLTTAYVAILMLISLFFSAVLYNLAANQLANSLRKQYVQLQRPNGSTVIIPSGAPPTQVQEELENGKRNLFLQLAYFNAIILALSGAISYLLAKQTLRPIEEALATQTRFTADASHELRTPLTAMQTEIEVSLRDKKLSLSEAKEQLKSNLEEVGKLRTLADSLLRLARNGSSQGMEYKVVKLDNIVSYATKQIKAEASKKRIVIKNKVKANSIKLKADTKSMTELLVILLDNAIKYSQPKTNVEILAKQTSRYTQIKVKDHGQGIPKVDLDHIFERFYRSDSARSKNSINGYGLGLSIAAKIAQQHGGNIEVWSKIGKGSVFTIVIPRQTK